MRGMSTITWARPKRWIATGLKMKSGSVAALRICLPLFVVAVAFAAFNPPSGVWGAVEPPKAQCEAYDTNRLRAAKSLTAEVYNLRKLNRMLREPQNTVSNLAYVYAGVALLWAGHRLLSRSLGLACIFLGVGSGLYHASLLPEWRMIDILGVYAVLFSLVLLGWSAVFRQSNRKFDRFAVLGTWLLAVPAGIHRNDLRLAEVKVLDSTYVVVGAVTLVSVAALISWRHARNYRHYFGAAATLTLAAPVAFFGGLADRFGGMLANPDALIQGHTVWHTLGAVAVLAAYEIFVSTGFDRSVFERGGA